MLGGSRGEICGWSVWAGSCVCVLECVGRRGGWGGGEVQVCERGSETERGGEEREGARKRWRQTQVERPTDKPAVREKERGLEKARSV